MNTAMKKQSDKNFSSVKNNAKKNKSKEFTDEDIRSFLENKYKVAGKDKKMKVNTIIPIKFYRINFFDFELLEGSVIKKASIADSKFVEIIIENNSISTKVHED